MSLHVLETKRNEPDDNEPYDEWMTKLTAAGQLGEKPVLGGIVIVVDKDGTLRMGYGGKGMSNLALLGLLDCAKDSILGNI